MNRVAIAKLPKLVIALMLLYMTLQSLGVKAQTKYSTKEDYLRSKSNAQAIITSFTNQPVDTSVLFAADVAFHNGLGAMGFSAPLLKLQKSAAGIGFRYFQLPLNESRLTAEQAYFYQTNGPFADLHGSIGAGKLQMFTCFFTNTFKDNLNIALRFNRNTYIGQYARQTAMLNNLAFTSNFASKDKRVGYYLTVLQNTNRNYENGGISDVLLSARNGTIRKELLNVQLSDAARDDRQLSFDLKPYVMLNAKAKEPKFEHYLQLNTSADIQSIKYSDKQIASDNFYNTFYYDSVKTLDSSNVKLYTNGLNYVLKQKNNAAAFTLGYKNEQIRVWQKNTTYYHNNCAQASLVLKKEKNKSDTLIQNSTGYYLTANAEQVVQGYNAGDLSAQVNAQLVKGNKNSLTVFVGAAFENRKPNQNFIAWRSNHFEWQTDFKQQQIIEAHGGLKFKKLFAVELLYQNIHHLLYFNEQALPAQLPGRTDNLAGTLSFSNVFFKHLGIYLAHTYQQSSSSAVVKLPNQISQAKLYYAANLFKRVLQLNLGAQVRHYSAFEGYGYMPATQVFYVQNKIRGGNFPFVDVYLSGRIRPVTFYVKLENILAGYAGYNYFLVPGYYQPGMAFRMGITWQFWD